MTLLNIAGFSLNPGVTRLLVRENVFRNHKAGFISSLKSLLVYQTQISPLIFSYLLSKTKPWSTLLHWLSNYFVILRFVIKHSLVIVSSKITKKTIMKTRRKNLHGNTVEVYLSPTRPFILKRTKPSGKHSKERCGRKNLFWWLHNHQ